MVLIVDIWNLRGYTAQPIAGATTPMLPAKLAVVLAQGLLAKYPAPSASAPPPPGLELLSRLVLVTTCQRSTEDSEETVMPRARIMK